MPSLGGGRSSPVPSLGGGHMPGVANGARSLSHGSSHSDPPPSCIATLRNLLTISTQPTAPNPLPVVAPNPLPVVRVSHEPEGVAAAPAHIPCVGPAVAAAAPNPPSQSQKLEHAILYVRISEGKTVRVKTPLSSTVEVLKKYLENPSGIAPAEQRLMYGDELLVDTRTLGNYAFTPHAVISMDRDLIGSRSGAGMSSESEAEEDELQPPSDTEHQDESADRRACVLCHKQRDRKDQGRLLPVNEDTWIHVNCALWSAETYEEEDGRLVQVNKAISRGKLLTCVLCGLNGATVGCCMSS